MGSTCFDEFFNSIKISTISSQMHMVIENDHFAHQGFFNQIGKMVYIKTYS